MQRQLVLEKSDVAVDDLSEKISMYWKRPYSIVKFFLSQENQSMARLTPNPNHLVPTPKTTGKNNNKLATSIWGFPWPWGNPKLDGLFHGKCPSFKRIMTGGSSISGNPKLVDENSPVQTGPRPATACRVPPSRLQGAMVSPANVNEISVAEANSWRPRSIRPRPAVANVKVGMKWDTLW